MPDFIKAQLQRLIDLLGLDISILVQDVRSIKEIFNQIKDDHPSSLKEIIESATFLDGNVLKFFSAQSRLVGREAQRNSATAESQYIQEILSVMKIVDLLKEYHAEINKDLAALNK